MKKFVLDRDKTARVLGESILEAVDSAMSKKTYFKSLEVPFNLDEYPHTIFTVSLKMPSFFHRNEKGDLDVIDYCDAFKWEKN